MAKTIDFKPMQPAAVLGWYQKTSLLFIALHGLTLPVIAVWLYLVNRNGFSFFSSLFALAFFAAGNWLLYNYGRVRRSAFWSILNKDCDPVKFEAVCRLLIEKEKSPLHTLNLARALFYQGRFEEALALAKTLPKFKEGTNPYFQYASLLVNCYEMLGEQDRIDEIRGKLQRVVAGMREKNRAIGNGRQLLVIIDCILASMNRDTIRCRELSDQLYDTASFALSRVSISMRMAQLDFAAGAGKSAADRCEYIVDDGGTTFYVERAAALLEQCQGRRKNEKEEEAEDGAF